jgi:hypothetical protein
MGLSLGTAHKTSSGVNTKLQLFDEGRRTKDAQGRRQDARTEIKLDERDEILSTERGEKRRDEKRAKRKTPAIMWRA